VKARIDEMSAKRPAAKAAEQRRAATEPSLSAFGDKSRPPSEAELRAALGAAHAAWAQLLERAAERIGPVAPVWGFTSAKSGWGLRVRRGERVILYMTPRRGSFLVSFALGEKAVAAARARRLPAAVLAAIDTAPRYAEGRGVRFEVRRAREVPALAALAGIKHEN
jgi:hypothetical protein